MAASEWLVEAGEGDGLLMTIWDLSDRQAWDALERRAYEDAWTCMREFWIVDYDRATGKPISGHWSETTPQNLSAFADERTREFLQESVGIPRRAFTNPELMQYHYREIGNCYYWTFRRTLSDAVADRVRTSGQMPLRTAPPIFQLRFADDPQQKDA